MLMLLLVVTASPAKAAKRFTEYPLPLQGSYAQDITTGPDGNLWFTEFNIGIGRITPQGVITEYAAFSPQDITAGPDGNLWFTSQNGNTIGRITITGDETEYPIPTPASYPYGITAGPDGNLWFTEYNGDKIGRITPGGVITEFPVSTKGTRSGRSASPERSPNIRSPEFSRAASPPAPMGICGSRRAAGVPSGDSRSTAY
jgi:streptogramin lyase